MTKVPKCMSTQHPDNATVPFFADSPEIYGEDEILEAYYAFSHLGCDEQMWDVEGKEVDSFVIRKLLTKHESYFREVRIGRDVFITLRVPNPTVERSEAKVLLETLESIPRSFDAAKLFYGDEIAPIFEVILPMTASARCIDRVYRYYRDFIIKKQYEPFTNGDITIAEWIGEFKPSSIDVIPLFEDMEQMLNAHLMTGEYLRDKDIEHQRVFLARSDPAMNFGFLSAVLLNKIALRRLHALSDEAGVRIYPIVGVGSAPFRGNMRPQTVDRVMSEYPSGHTFTIQSAFKYDNEPETVRAAIGKLMASKTGPPQELDEERCLEVVGRYTAEYQKQVVRLAPVVNGVARFIPSRRRRKLHIGLFGYSRRLGETSLPRVITFTAALYSVGLPPEVLGLNALTADDIRFVREVYPGFDEDLGDALKYLNPSGGFVPEEIAKVLGDSPVGYRADGEHGELTGRMTSMLKDSRTESMVELVTRAARLRRFLG